MSGEQLKKRLNELGITVTALAEKLGITQPSMSAALQVKDVKSTLLENICIAYGLKMSVFYPDDYAVTNTNMPYAHAQNLHSRKGDINNTNNQGGTDSDMLKKLIEQNTQLISIIKANME